MPRAGDLQLDAGLALRWMWLKNPSCPAKESSNSKLGCEVNTAHSAATVVFGIKFARVKNESLSGSRNHRILLK